MGINFQAGQRFFIDFEGEEGFLPSSEAHHAVRVLRKREGDLIKLIDGKGKEFRGKILEINWKKRTPVVRVRIEEILRVEEEPRYNVLALIPHLKGDLTEFLIEKGTELGVTSFLIYHSERTIARSQEFRVEPLLEKAISSLKQSGRLLLPEITYAGELRDYLRSLEISGEEVRVLAHQTGSDPVFEIFKDITERGVQKILLAIGPEGDFTEEELRLFQERAFKFLKLGPYILRAETAFCVLCGLTSTLLCSINP